MSTLLPTSAAVRRALRVSASISRGEIVTLDDCLAVTEQRMLGVWQSRMLLRRTEWTPLFDGYQGPSVFSDPLDPIHAERILEAQRAMALATVVSPDDESERVGRTLRRVIVLWLERGAPGEQRWLAAAWRRVDPLGYAERALHLRRAPYPGIEAEPPDKSRQSLVDRLLDSSRSEDRLLALRLMQSIGT